MTLFNSWLSCTIYSPAAILYFSVCLLKENLKGCACVYIFNFCFVCCFVLCSWVFFRKTLGTGLCQRSRPPPRYHILMSTLAGALHIHLVGHPTALWQRWPVFSWSLGSSLVLLEMRNSRYGRISWWFSLFPPLYSSTTDLHQYMWCL